MKVKAEFNGKIYQSEVLNDNLVLEEKEQASSCITHIKGMLHEDGFYDVDVKYIIER